MKLDKIDKIDKKLLTELVINSRQPITQLAKKLRVSREVATYRINRLVKNKIIQEFFTIIDFESLGFVGAAVFLNVKSSSQNKFKKYLTNCGFVSWVAELSGVWSFGLSIIGKNNEQLDENFMKLYQEFKEDIIDHRWTLHKKTIFFYEKYFEGKKEAKKTIEKTKNKLDSTDLVLLKELSKNSRIDSVKLSQILKMSAPAVVKRIRKLESEGIIKGYSTFIDTSKIGLYQYSIFIVNKKIEEKEKLITYLEEHPLVNFLAEYIGDDFLEFGLFVDNPYKLRNKLQEIEQNFPNNRVFEVSLFQKEFVSIGLPNIIFETLF